MDAEREARASDDPGTATARGVDRSRTPLDPGEERAQFASAVGRRMGHFVLEAFIEGGRDSAVFRARRVVGRGEKLAAIKLLRGGSPEPQVARLFDEERRSLASLDHPAIPRLLGSGVTRDGWSWFAKQHALGWPLIRYAHDSGVGLAERVSFMIQVCRAVEHAHGRKVLHLDLHPESLMVTTTGELKVLGFGLPGLPTGKDVSDLGELLFQVARPVRPFLDELRGSGSSTRGSRSQGLRRSRARPSSDADRVVLKAVGHGPRTHYASAAALAEDLERLLEGRPVSARRIPLMGRVRAVLGRLVQSGVSAPTPQGSPSPSSQG